MLVDVMSMRTVSQITGVSINTASKFRVDAGNAYAEYYDKTVRGVKGDRVQCDEIWSFVAVKAKNIKDTIAAVYGAADA